ncbi:MAG: hypothetical protein ICV83_27300 [Cytophagales bacterium]|nr:hypothetical protein [Cytophagales bacterium]
MITMYDFIKLSLDDRIDKVLEDGVFLTGTQKKGDGYALMDLHGFYVEFRYNLVTKDVKEVIPFRKGKKLDFYIKYISLRDLHQKH